MPSVFSRLCWLVYFSRWLFADLVKSCLRKWCQQRAPIRMYGLGILPTASEISLLPSGLTYLGSVLIPLDVITIYVRIYSKQSIQVCFTTSLPTPPPARFPPTNPLAMLSIKIHAHLKKCLKVPKIQAAASYKISCVLANEQLLQY